MIKKINKFLLLYFPLIWNTRAFWMLLTLFALHFTFYWSGWWYFDGFKKLQQSIGESTSTVSNANFAYAFIISILAIIIWLVFYFRNNPFKSFYPLPRGYFAIEFCIIFLVMMGFLTLPESYARGFYDAIEHKTKDINVTDEVNTLNLAFALIPERSSDYASHNCCDSLDYRESKEYIDLLAREDSVRRIATREKEGVYDADDGQGEDEETKYRKYPSYYDYNYFNFCRQFNGYYDSAALGKRGISEKLQLLLTTHDKAGATAILVKFDQMCRRYIINYNVSLPSYAELAFKDENHKVTKFLGEFDEHETITPNVDFEGVNQVLRKIYGSRHRDFEGDLWMVNFFIALFLAMGLYTFRLSSTRVWLISLVTGGVVLIIYAISAALIRTEYFALGFAIFLVCLFYLLFLAMRSARRKTLSGVNLVMFSWAFPGLFMLIHQLIAEIYRPVTIYDPIALRYVQQPSPVYTFLQDYQGILFTIYYVLTFLVVISLLYRNYRSWQAMDEE